MFQKKVVKNIITHILFSIIIPPPPENRAVYEIMWKYMAEADRTRCNNTVEKRFSSHQGRIKVFGAPRQ